MALTNCLGVFESDFKMPSQDSDINVLRIARSWLDQKRNIALATVISTWGSAPRSNGAHLVIDGDGNFEGSVSGGCVEGAVIIEALEVIKKSTPKVLEFGVEDETAWQIGLSCGGNITIWLEPICSPDAITTLTTITSAVETRQALARVINLDNGQSSLVFSENTADNPSLQLALSKRFKSNRSAIETIDQNPLFIRIYRPDPRLIIIGAVHIAQTLASIAHITGFDVTIIDPRQAFATKKRFATVKLIADWPEKALEKIGLDSYCALAALSHDPKIDDFALINALRTGCFYVGALGSSKTHVKRIRRLSNQGLSQKILKHIHAPIGLDIAAANPPEIAIAILAEIVREWRKR